MSGFFVAFLAATSLGPLDVPFVPQAKDTCGAASLAMVLRYWGLTADHDALAAAARDPNEPGIAGARLVELARGLGLFALAYEGDLEELEGQIAKGRPVIVALRTPRGTLHHDVVVVGFADGDVLVNDPFEGRERRLARADFDRRWRAASRWALLVLPR